MCCKGRSTIFGNRLAGVTVVLLLLTLTAAVPASVAASSPPFSHVPDGWCLWGREDGAAIWLPDDAQPGEQQTFFLVVPMSWVDRVAGGWDDLPPRYLGGGTVIWEGRFSAGGTEWEAVIASDGGRHGMVARSSQWAVIAVAPEADWDDDAAPQFNAILRGGEQ